MAISFRTTMILRSLWAVFVVLAIVDLSYAQAVPTSERKEGDLWFEPFQIQAGAEAFDGELGRLVVRENRKNPKSNLIELAFVRFKSTAADPGFPVVYLDGGPGSSAIGLARVPDYMKAFQKLREVGDVILLDQRGVGRSRPSFSRASTESLPADIFLSREIALAEFKKRAKESAEHFKSQGVDILAYNSIESANDVDDLRKALSAQKVNLVGFSYGTHLGLACIRYHGKNLNRVVLIGTEGPDHTDKLPSTSDESIRRLSRMVAADPNIGPKMPDLYATLKRVLDRLDKEPAVVTVTDQRTKKPVELKIGRVGLQFLIMRDLGDTNDLPNFPLWFFTMDKGDYSMLKRYAERRYNQFGGGLSLMTLVMDSSSGATAARKAQMKREAATAILGDIVNFPLSELGDAFGSPDLGDEYRSAIKTDVPTLFVSGVLDNNTQPFQADEVRKTFRSNVHLVIDNAGHESMLTDAQVQQVIVDYLNGKDVSKIKISLPPLRFDPIPAAATGSVRPN